MIIIPTLKKDPNADLFNVNIRENNTEKYRSVKYLGIIIDENSNWKQHIKKTFKKASQAISAFVKFVPMLVKRC